MRPEDWDPLAKDVLADPHGAYAALRRRCPVAWSSRWDGFWTLTRYRDVVRVAGDSRTFISSVQNLVPKSPRTGLSRRPLSSDPPEHTVFRRILNEHFSEERVARLQPGIQAMVARYVGPFVERCGGEAMGEVIGHLPVRAVCLWLDVPERDAEWIQERSTRYVAALGEDERELAGSLSAELDGYARDLVARRQAERRPRGGDAVTDLLHVRIGGEPIPPEWVAGTVRMLLVAADRSTAAGAGFAVEWLARDPELQAQLRAEPSNIPEAIEELLRLGSPSQVLVRTATRDTVLAGRPVEGGEAVAMLFSAANRDPDAFHDPDHFRLDRTFKRHLAFGHGIHKCAGAALARLELRVVLEELLSRTRSWRLAGDVPHTRWPEYGPLHLPLSVEPAL
ncbi:MAG: cytochrome P450 [Candidatus Dormibacteraeota bacterium]|nr:cytochrome P450 [Candidatus Dormibacteraeota bacterium]